MQMLDGRLQRRVGMAIRRDAAEELPNGRKVFSALFSRTGIQTYGDSVEYRPDSEVFAAASRKSGNGSPGVLLHPSQNFTTKFDGRYPVKGCTGTIEVHNDGIHTTGELYVWDGDWLDAIERQTMAELSVGYTIIADRTPGTAPDGTRYDVVHRDIVWDHVAGVPAGNAGTARVVTDSMTLATRAALADIAAARMDAKPLYFDLGRWPTREKPRMDKDDQTPDAKEYVKRDALADAAPRLAALGPKPSARQVLDVWIDVCGLSDDPAMLKVCKALGEMEAPGAGSSGTYESPVMDAAQLEQQRLDVAEIADERADVLELARVVFGRDYQHRAPVLDAQSKPVMDAAGKPKTSPKATDAIKREIIGKVDAGRLTRVDAYADEPKRAVALDMQLAEVRAIVDARMSRAPIDALLAEIEQARADNARGTQIELTAEQKAMADRVAAANDPTKQRIFGRTPANT